MKDKETGMKVCDNCCNTGTIRTLGRKVVRRRYSYSTGMTTEFTAAKREVCNECFDLMVTMDWKRLEERAQTRDRLMLGLMPADVAASLGASLTQT